MEGSTALIFVGTTRPIRDMSGAVQSLDLSIVATGDPERAVALARFGDDFAVEVLPCVLIQKLEAFRNQLALAARGAGLRPKRSELTDFGRDLFRFTVQNSLKRLYQRLPQSALRIRILSNRPDLQSLPWEYFQDPDANPGPDIQRSVVRIVPTIGIAAPSSLKLNKTVRMLFVYADPADQGSVSWPEVQDTITGQFRRRIPTNFEIDVVESATKESLATALAGKNYDLFHFNGHGEVRANGKGQLLLVNFKTKKSQPLLAEELALLLKGRGLRLAVLGACSTSEGDFAKPYSVIAETLVTAGIPAVVANQFAVSNTAVATFTAALYEELLRSGDIDQAVAEGRNLLAMQPSVGPDEAPFEWGIPTLYRHMGAAQVFKSTT